MSYILDALRRADAERERERGGVPGLHTMPVGSVAPAAPARTPWVAAALTFTVLALLLLGWWFRPIAPAAEPALAAPPAALPPSPVVAAAPPAAQTAPPPPTGAAVASAPSNSTPAAAAREPAPEPAPATPGATPTAVRPKLRDSLPPPPPAAPTRSSARPTTATPPTSASPAAPAGVPSAVSASAAGTAAPMRSDEQPVAFEQLPDDVKRALPPLAIGGAIYSDNPGSRLLMVGGQLLKEGDRAGPGVTLEQIRPRSAVLRWKDVRYEVRF
jgi:general secretion pathway protein B